MNVLPGNALGPAVSNPPVVERYGLNVSTTGLPILKKIDHCEWTNAASARTMVRRLGPTRDVSQCIAECRAQGIGSCNSVQVVRAINPSWTLPYEINVPWIPYSFNSTLGLINLVAAYNEICATLDVDGRTKRGCTNPPTKNANFSAPAYANLTTDDFLWSATTHAHARAQRHRSDEWRKGNSASGDSTFALPLCVRWCRVCV